MSLLKVIWTCITLFVSPYYTNSFPDAPPEYVTQECKDKATSFNIQKVPLAYNSALLCMYQNLQVLENMTFLDLALATPHTGSSICRIEVHWFNKTAKRVNMTIYDTDLRGSCTPRKATDIVEAVEDGRTKQLSELRISRKLDRTSKKRENARLLFTDYKKCLILITPFFGTMVKYCELFVQLKDSINMHDTQCHSIYRIYCGYGRPTRGVWPNPVESSTDELFLMEAYKLRFLIERKDPLEEDTLFMNEFQMISEVLYHIPDANVYASTLARTESRLCGITTFKVMPDMAELELQMISSGRKKSEYTRFYYPSDRNAISATQIYLSNQYGLRRVLVSNFKSCYVFKKVDENWPPICELFLKNNTSPITDLKECWFVFLAYCGYPKAFYDKTSCYS